MKREWPIGEVLHVALAVRVIGGHGDGIGDEPRRKHLALPPVLGVDDRLVHAFPHFDDLRLRRRVRRDDRGYEEVSHQAERVKGERQRKERR